MLDVARPPSRGAQTIRWFAVLFAVSLLLAVAGSVSGLEALALSGGYGVVFFGIGAAPFQLRTDLDLYARLTGTILTGFSVLLGVGGLMADIHGLWHPVLAAVIVGVPAIALHVLGFRRTLARPHGELGQALLSGFADIDDDELRFSAGFGAAAPDLGGEDSYGRGGSSPIGDLKRFIPWWDGWRPQRVGLLVTLAGTVMWLVPALLTRDPNPGYWGMLATIGPLWYAGLVLVLVGFAVGRASELTGAVAAFSFALATTLTPALVYGAPREQTAGKQMELTQYVLVHHHIPVTAGIYQAYSSTFSGIGALCQLLGIHGMIGGMSLWGLATYWPVLLAVMRVAELRLLMGRLVATTPRRWGGVMLVLLVDSLGADYYSPQAVGYVMAVGIVALALHGVNSRPLGTRWTFWMLLLAGVALGPTHELSPYMVAGALIVLAIFGQTPWWTCLPIALPALGWAAIVHKAVQRHFTFGALFNLSNFRPPVTVATPGLHRLAVVGTQSHMLLVALLILILLGALGFLPNIRTRWAWAYALCPIVGLGFIAINPYGNEGIFRATLFAIPWMAVLAMKMPEPGSRLRVLMRPAAVTAAVSLCLVTLLATFLIAAYAMDGTNVLPRNDVQVVDYLMRLPRRNAYVLTIGSAGNPADGADFTLNYSTLEWSQVATVRELRRRHPTAIAATALADRFGLVAQQQGASRSSPLYVIWSHASLMYTNAYGLQSPAQMRAWLHVLMTAPSWRLVDHRGGTYLFRLR